MKNALLALPYFSLLLFLNSAAAATQDSDGDGVFDHYEVMAGTNPNDPSSAPKDMDKDGIPDAHDLDIDGDGVNNWQDPFPTNPQEFADADGDGVGDTQDLDSDGDGFSNVLERQAGTNPYDKRSFPDTDKPIVELAELPEEVNDRYIKISGMALDSGMGIDKVRVINDEGEVFVGYFTYATHFAVDVKLDRGLNQLQLAVSDKAKNIYRELIELDYEP